MKFLTYKSGKFYFTHKYSDREFINDLLAKIEILHETIVDLPILPNLASQLKPDILYSSIAGTAAIENNPIPTEGVEQIANKKNIDGYSQKHKQEITNLLNGYDVLSRTIPMDLEPFQFELSEEFIRDLHKIVTDGVPHEKNIPGNYRNGVVHVGDGAHGGVYKPPKILEDVKNLMEKFIEWVNSEEIMGLNPFIRAALAHYHFCLIHPFWDGNGRTARLIETMILEAAAIKYIPKMLTNYYYKNVDDYYIAFSKTESLKGEDDISPFLGFVLSSAVASLKEIKERIIFSIRMFAMHEGFRLSFERRELTKRQYQFLLIMPHNPGPFALKDLKTNPAYATLYSSVSTQTARRDLKKFVEGRYLLKDEEDRYRLNYRRLG